MNAIKHEMVTVEIQNKELEQLVTQYIHSKYPFLKDETVWSWEDFDINFSGKQDDRDKVAVYSYHSKTIQKYDKQECSGCNKIDPFNTVCR